MLTKKCNNPEPDVGIVTPRDGVSPAAAACPQRARHGHHRPSPFLTASLLVLGLFSLPLTSLADSETSEPTTFSSADAPEPDNPAGIVRNGEGRLFYSTIKIPPGAETLYLSGSGASPDKDGNWGDMEAQAISTFNKFKATLEEQGWSMSDIVQVRAFAVAGEYGLLDFDGFNRGYSQFFGTEDNPNKPVRSFVQVADLVVDGWLVEIEIRAARVPE